MLGERRRPVLDWDLVARTSLAWALISVLLVIATASSIYGRIFHDGDDIMRLIEVRDWIGGQSWFDNAQYRINAPFGATMHWSRLVDIPIAFVIVVLSPIVGQSLAEQAAAVTVPLFTLFIVLLLIGRIAWRLFDEQTAVRACAAAAFSAPLLHQLSPMRIDHHGWQIAFALLAVNAMMARNARPGGWIMGFALASWLNISLEALPFVVAFCVVLLARWLRCWDDRLWLASMLQSLAVSSALLYLVTHGTQLSMPLCDVIAPAHLLALAVIAVGATGLAHLEVPRPWLFTVLILGASGLAGAAGLLVMAPQCTGGTFGGLDPVARDVWLANVVESKPIWHHPPDLIVQVIVPAILGIVVSIRLALRSSAWLYRWHFEYAGLLIAALALAIVLPRSSDLVGALAAVPIGYQLKVWGRMLRDLNRPGKKAMAVAGIITALLPAFPLTLLMMAAPSNASSSAASGPAPACNIPAALPTLGKTPANILAPIDMGPAILLDSPHRVVATAHHRAHEGIGDTIRAFTGSPDRAHAIITHRDIDFVVMCAGIGETMFYRGLDGDNFAKQLASGDAPDWLMPIAEDRVDGVMIWRVIG